MSTPPPTNPARPTDPDPGAEDPSCTRQQIQIRVPLPCPEPCAEWLWATPLGGDCFRVDNVPFFTHELGLHDEVIALPTPAGREFVAVLTRRCVASFSYQLRVHPRDFFDEVDAWGVASEGADGYLYATNVHSAELADKFERFLAPRCLWAERFGADGRLVSSIVA